MEPKSTPGEARRAENSLWEFSGPPPGGTREFFSAPRGLQERSGADFIASQDSSFDPGASGGALGGSRRSF